MKIKLNFKTIVYVNLVLLIPLCGNAQNKFYNKLNCNNHVQHSLKIGENISSIFELNHEDNIKNVYPIMHPIVNETQLSTIVLDSVVAPGHHKKLFTYDESGNNLTDIREEWDTDSSMWINDRRYTYTYDESGDKLTDLRENWNADSSMWINNYRFTYTYDENGNILSELLEFWNNGQINNYRLNYTYTYDENGNLLTILVKKGNLVYRRNTYTYDENGNRLSEILFAGLICGHNSGEITYTYDESGNLLSEHEHGGCMATRTWRYTYTYDDSGNILSELYEEWRHGRGVVLDISWEAFYYYSPKTSINNPMDLLQNYSLSQNFPNPFNPTTTISYSILKHENVEISVYNSIGQKISVLIDKKHAPGNYKVNFYGSNLSNGIYFYQIITSDFVKTRKMILLK